MMFSFHVIDPDYSINEILRNLKFAKVGYIEDDGELEPAHFYIDENFPPEFFSISRNPHTDPKDISFAFELDINYTNPTNSFIISLVKDLITYEKSVGLKLIMESNLMLPVNTKDNFFQRTFRDGTMVYLQMKGDVVGITSPSLNLNQLRWDFDVLLKNDQVAAPFDMPDDVIGLVNSSNQRRANVVIKHDVRSNYKLDFPMGSTSGIRMIFEN